MHRVAGITPTRWPRLYRDTTHEASELVKGIEEPGDVKRARKGEGQPDMPPDCICKNIAKTCIIKLILILLIYVEIYIFVLWKKEHFLICNITVWKVGKKEYYDDTWRCLKQIVKRRISQELYIFLKYGIITGWIYSNIFNYSQKIYTYCENNPHNSLKF